MPIDLSLSSGTLVSFLLVLARIAGVFTFLPIPGGQQAPVVARIVCALSITIVLAPVWPNTAGMVPEPGRIVWWLANESVLGIALGLVVALAAEAFTLAAQVVSLQAGYSYATTIDPTSQVDAGLLPLLWQLLTGVLFFATGLDVYVLRILGESLSRCPPGQCTIAASSAGQVIALGQQMLVLGLRLALPVIVLLILVDLGLAFVSRVSSQLQLLSLAFPVKLLGVLVCFALVMPVAATLYREAVEKVAPVLASLLRVR